MPRAPHRIQLRQANIVKAKPKDDAYIVRDAAQPHLALRVWPSGRRVWVVIYSRSGRSRWLTLGDAGIVGLAEAREMCAEAMLAVIKGRDPGAEKAAERGKGTFQEVAAKYVETYAKIHNKSYRQAEALIRARVLPRIGRLQFTTITRSDIKSVLDHIKDAPIVRNQVLAAISVIFNWAIKEEIVTVNPARLIDKNPTNERSRILAESEIAPFWKALDGLADPIRARALKVLLLTGQRPGEVCCMRHEHIVDGWWQMPGKKIPEIGWPGTKNGLAHTVWLPAPVRDLIGAEQKVGFVFAGARGKPPRDLDKDMRKISAEIFQADPVIPHDLRRTHGSAVAKKFGRPTMHRLQNHKEGGMSDVYDRNAYADENRNAMEVTADHFMTIIEGRVGKLMQFPALS